MSCLLEIIQKLKQEKGIGIYQAWRAYKIIQHYEELSDHINRELEKADIEYSTTWEEAHRVCIMLRYIESGFDEYLDYKTKFDDEYHEAADEIRELYRRLAAGYFILIGHNDDKSKLQELLGILTFSNVLKRVMNTAHDSDTVTELLLEGMTVGLDLYFSDLGPLLSGCEENDGNINENEMINPCPYIRAIAEKTSHKYETERQIALNFIQRYPVVEQNPVRRIQMAKENAHRMIETGFRGEIGQLVTNPTPLKVLMEDYFERGVQKPEEYIYRIVHHKASEKDREDFRINKGIYLLRAIEENEAWLFKMLSS